MYSGLSLRDISYGTDKKELRRLCRSRELTELAVKRGTKISVSSLFNTIKDCKLKLKAKLGEDFEDYHNGQF